MMTTIKHSKFRNTGILFELLSRQIAVDVLNNNNSKSIAILKKYFNENTALGKESHLYQTLINEKFNSESNALNSCFSCYWPDFRLCYVVKNTI